MADPPKAQKRLNTVPSRRPEHSESAALWALAVQRLEKYSADLHNVDHGAAPLLSAGILSRNLLAPYHIYSSTPNQ